MTSRWRTEARALIACVVTDALEEAPKLRDNPGALIAFASKAYPHTKRTGSTWKVWLDELALARTNLELQLGTPLAKRCSACGARPRKPCRPISDVDTILEERQLATEAAPKRRARELADAIVHAARRVSEAA